MQVRGPPRQEEARPISKIPTPAVVTVYAALKPFINGQPQV